MRSTVRQHAAYNREGYSTPMTMPSQELLDFEQDENTCALLQYARAIEHGTIQPQEIYP